MMVRQRGVAVRIESPVCHGPMSNEVYAPMKNFLCIEVLIQVWMGIKPYV